ncbi:putative glycolipid-binding domain-containing protein, partial [Devosia sp.]|uniref:putative glycolipid-binding domain-containing protein n=1 Tax=Devosia sp. TaxID=1871048 RepID=UPI001ACEBEDE
MSLNQSYRWRGLDLKTLEHCHVIANGRDTRIRGAVIGEDFGLFYRIKLDENGHTRTLRIERADGKALELFPDQPQVMNYLGYSWVDMNTNLKEALAMIQKAVD